MAKATVRTIPPVPVKPQVEVTLILDAAEANTLAEILARISGPIESSARKYSDRVATALSNAGFVYRFIESSKYQIAGYDDDVGGRNIYFNERSLAHVER